MEFSQNDLEERAKYYNLVNHLKTVSEFQEKLHNLTNAIKIERSIFNYTKDYILDNHKGEHLFRNVYEYKKNSLLNTDLDFNNLNVDLIIVAYLKPNELKPECFTSIQNKINKRNEKKNHIEYSDVFVCRRCKQKKCISSVIVTRGLDENLTTVVNCYNCGNVFTV